MSVIVKLPNTQETFDWLEENCGPEWIIDTENMEHVWIEFDDPALAQMAVDGCAR